MIRFAGRSATMLRASRRNPVLPWLASYVSVETDAADNWKPSKNKSTERIDGIVALIMAIDRATTQLEFGSLYETRGILTL